jgi:hypothetical protein
MPISGSCDGVGPAFDQLTASRAQKIAQRLPDAPQDKQDALEVQRVSRDFASLFYTMLVQQMQKTAREQAYDDGEEEGGMRESVDGFVGMFLPQAIAGQSNDPLSTYIYGHLSKRNGGPPDEKA